MYVQAVLLMREGLKHFDPGSDLLLNLRQPAQFLTWRKQGQTWSHDKVRFEKLPYGSGVVGAFLSDVFGNISYAGYIDEQPGGRVRDYISHVLPLVKDSYTHTRYNKLFAPPESFAELIDKLRDVNRLYFRIFDNFEINFSDVDQCRWLINEYDGLTGILVPRESSKQELADIYSEIIGQIKPGDYRRNITWPVYDRTA
jgi:hypothetical protein